MRSPFQRSGHSSNVEVTLPTFRSPFRRPGHSSNVEVTLPTFRSPFQRPGHPSNVQVTLPTSRSPFQRPGHPSNVQVTLPTFRSPQSWVPHISPSFGEMWERKLLSRAKFQGNRTAFVHLDRSVPGISYLTTLDNGHVFAPAPTNPAGCPLLRILSEVGKTNADVEITLPTFRSPQSWVPHISPSFGEMWERKLLSRAKFQGNRTAFVHLDRSVPGISYLTTLDNGHVFAPAPTNPAGCPLLRILSEVGKTNADVEIRRPNLPKPQGKDGPPKTGFPSPPK